MILLNKVGIIFSMEVLGNRLKELRSEKKISLDRLGKEIGVSDTAILKWEQNKSEPTALNIKQLAIYFEVTSDYLLGLEDETGTKTYISNSFNNFNNTGSINIK